MDKAGTLDRQHADKHPLDIPHVTAVELPLNVKNTSRAIGMLGGRERIRTVINSSYKPSPIQPASHSVDERKLELRLRKDPFHHPVQASVNRREKVLVKVSVPKTSLPVDYHQNPSKYTIRELLARNRQLQGAAHRVEPVAIINRNYSFRGMADFQMATKNNDSVQQFQRDVACSDNFDITREFYHDQLTRKDGHADARNYENRDHRLVPPPLFSSTRFPYDYRYKKNSFTVALRDDSGNVRVVMKTDGKKLFANTVDYHKGTVPRTPMPEIVAKREWLAQANLAGEYADQKLWECIQCLEGLFAVKPVWFRKVLVETVSPALRSAVKEALPYVSYCYKNGPWRFCNVKLGVDPAADRAFWRFQCESFRMRVPVAKGDASRRQIVPPTIARDHPDCAVTVPEDMLFTGTALPRAINFQVGDIVDADVVRVLAEAEARGGNGDSDGGLLRAAPDPQDGWLSRQVCGTVRALVRYKLRRLQHDEPIEPAEIARIVEADYSLKEGVPVGEDGDEDGDGEDDEEDEDADDADAEDAEVSGAVNEAEVIGRVKEADEHTAAKLQALVGLLKQDALVNAYSEEK